ncbi:MAG: hypothetical protein AABW92_05300 [Nanoarchaeota archaeon]
MDKKLKIVLIFIGLILVIGISLGFLIKGGYGCTKMGCPCRTINNTPYVGERPCNGCAYRNPIFVLGLFNVFKECHATEIILCGNELTNSIRYDIDYSSCKFVTGLSFYTLGS